MGAPFVYATNGSEYIVQDDLTAAIDGDVVTQLADDDENGAIDTEVLARAITAARSVVEAYARNKYPIPLINSDGEVPEIVREWNINIALYKLFGHRTGIPDSIVAAYLETIETLKTFGEPILVATPELQQATQSITGNMTETDLEWTLDVDIP